MLPSRSRLRPIAPRVAALALAALVTFVGGCGAAPDGAPTVTTSVRNPATTTAETVAPTTTVAGRSSKRAELAAARAAWAAASLHSYAMRYQLECFCPVGSWRVHVVDDRVSFVEAADDLRSAPPGLPQGLDVTMAGLYDRIERALDEAASVEVVYGEFGSPTSAAIDWIGNAVDDEETFRVSDVAAETPPPMTATRQAALDALGPARTRWQARGTRNYEFDLTVGCECPTSGSWHVRVLDGAYVDAALPSGVLQDAPGRPTVDALLTLVERSLHEGATVVTTYDADDGHPTTILVDRLPGAADGQVQYTVGPLTNTGASG